MSKRRRKSCQPPLLHQPYRPRQFQQELARSNQEQSRPIKSGFGLKYRRQFFQIIDELRRKERDAKLGLSFIFGKRRLGKQDQVEERPDGFNAGQSRLLPPILVFVNYSPLYVLAMEIRFEAQSYYSSFELARRGRLSVCAGEWRTTSTWSQSWGRR